MLALIKGMIIVTVTVIAVILGFKLEQDSQMAGVRILGDFAPAYSFTFLLGCVGLLITSIVMREFETWVKERIASIKASDIFSGVIGMLVGLFIINMILILPLLFFFRINTWGPSFKMFDFLIPFFKFFLPVLLNILGAYVGASVMIKYRGEMFSSLAETFISQHEPRSGNKVLDTSVIIDGRILDIAKTGFIQGRLYVPKFVLAELQYIADSSEALRRNRGRRGLEILSQLQDEPHADVEIIDKDFPEVREVDAKLVELAAHLNAEILTNDYSLNRVAELQGIQVLNINALSNALKPVVLPGEEMTVKILRPGQQEGQGVGYLDDGTMIVVENGKPYIGQELGVVVTSVLQTSAGRMIFTRVPEEDRRPVKRKGRS